MMQYDNCELSDLEALVYKDMVKKGLDPQNQEHIEKFWKEKLNGQTNIRIIH